MLIRLQVTIHMAPFPAPEDYDLPSTLTKWVYPAIALDHRNLRYHTPLSDLSYSINVLSVGSVLEFVHLVVVVEGVAHRPTLTLDRPHIFVRLAW